MTSHAHLLIQTREKAFPNLFQVAMNTLPVQASAVSCERVFSSAKRTITDDRNRLVAQTIETKQIVKYALKSARFSLQSRWNTSPLEASAATIAEDLEAALKSRNADTLEALMEEFKSMTVTK
jgi:hypothetical protein